MCSSDLVRVCGVAHDELVRPLLSAVDLEFPPGTDAQAYVFSRHRPAGLPQRIDYIHTRLEYEHLAIVLSPEFRQFVRGFYLDVQTVAAYRQTSSVLAVSA